MRGGRKTSSRWLANKKDILGGNPGLVLMGGDPCAKGRQFESQHRILDGHFSHLFVVKIVMMFV